MTKTSNNNANQNYEIIDHALNNKALTVSNVN